MVKLGGAAIGIGGPPTLGFVKKIHAGPLVRNDPGDWLRCPDHGHPVAQSIRDDS